MCGIAGFLERGVPQLSRDAIAEMLARLRHRGPEGTSWLAVHPDGGADWSRAEDPPHGGPLMGAIGCARLRIQDVSDAGLQPLANGDETIWAVQNGEIYNFVELRRELEALGRRFRTGSDTEVIPHAYQVWGDDCFSRFNGKFAIAILDRRQAGGRDRLILARDRMGVAPLFYAEGAGRLVFASEIGALVRGMNATPGVNEHRLARIIGLPYKRHGERWDSLYDGVLQVPAGGRVIVEGADAPLVESYWRPEDAPRSEARSFLEAREELRGLLRDAVQIRLRSDRRVAFIVSGGIDSSSSIGIAREHCAVEPETFSLDIPDARFNEMESIQEVIDFNGVRSHIVPVTADEIARKIPTVLDQADEPLPTANALLHGLLAEAIDAADFKVALNGVGGDEAFFGYHDHFLYHLYALERSGSPLFEREMAAWKRTQRRDPDLYPRFKAFMASDAAEYSPDFLARSAGADYRRLLRADLRETRLATPLIEGHDRFSPRDKQILDMMRLTLPYALRMDDGCYMAHAVETRQPFLDYRVIEYGLGLPDHLRIQRGVSKVLLRSAVRGYVPASRRRDLKKVGLNLPIDEWMRGPLKSWLEELLGSPSEPIYHYADHAAATRLMREHEEGRQNHSMKLWDLANVNHWLRRAAA